MHFSFTQHSAYFSTSTDFISEAALLNYDDKIYFI